MTSQLFIVKKTSMLPHDIIHITLKCVVHLYNHQNKPTTFLPSCAYANT
jgi:hypothetical protein